MLMVRQECAASENVWEGLYIALDHDFEQDINLSKEEIQVLQAVLRFGQFLFAGVPIDNNGANGSITDLLALRMFN